MTMLYKYDLGLQGVSSISKVRFGMEKGCRSPQE